MFRQTSVLTATPRAAQGVAQRLWQGTVDAVNVTPPYIWLLGLGFATLIGLLLPATLKFTAAFMLAVVLILLCAISPRRSMDGLWFLVVFEGAIRKWIAPGTQEFIYFGKDVFLLGMYLGVAVRGYLSETSDIAQVPRAVRALSWLFVAYVILDLFNPRLANYLVGIFGARNYLFYLGLMVITPYIFASRGDFYRFLKIQILIAAAVCVLGVVQFGLPPDHAINRYANDLHNMDIAGFNTGAQERARVTGTFSYITGYTSYLTIMAVLLLPFAFVSGGRERWLYSVAAVLMLGNTIMTGSRLPVALIVALVPAFIQLATFGHSDAQQAATIRRRLYLRTVLISAAAFVVIFTFFREPLAGLEKRFDQYNDEGGRMARLYTEPLRTVQEAGLFGYGPGTTHQATPVIMRVVGTWAEMPADMSEEDPGRVMLDLGFAGFLLWYLLRAALIVWNWQLLTAEKDGFFRLMLIALFLVQIACLPTQTVVNHTQLTMFWFAIGAMRIPPKQPVVSRRRKKYVL